MCKVLAFMDRQSSAQNLKVALLGLKCAIPVYHDNKHNRFLTTLTGSLLSRTNWNRGMLLCNSVSVQKISTTLETLSLCASDCKKRCGKALQSWRYRAKGAQGCALGSWRQNKVFLGLWSSCRAHSFHESVVRFFPIKFCILLSAILSFHASTAGPWSQSSIDREMDALANFEQLPFSRVLSDPQNKTSSLRLGKDLSNDTLFKKIDKKKKLRHSVHPKLPIAGDRHSIGHSVKG